MSYWLRRLFALIPLLLAINLFIFGLFFIVNSPDDMARMHLGQKHVTEGAIAQWKHERGYDRPLFFAREAKGLNRFTDTLFFQKSLSLLRLDFGRSDAGSDIGADLRERVGPSLAIAVPTLILGLGVDVTLALLLLFFRLTRLEWWGLALSTGLLSISTLFFIILGQSLFGRVLRLVPISGFDDGLNGLKFVILPILIGVLAGLGSGVRWYRALFIEEVEQDYVRTARAKGLSEWRVLRTHVFRNALIPILTGVVATVPLLFTGSLLMESFFAIPGLGSYTIEALAQQDFAIVRAMVFLGSLMSILGLLLTDLSYLLADPRVRLSP